MTMAVSVRVSRAVEAFDRWAERDAVRRARASAKADKVAVMRSLRATGSTLQDIADVYGVTRERVRQLVGEPKPASVGRVSEVLAAFRRPGMTITRVCREMGVSERAMFRILDEMGMLAAVRRLSRWRARRLRSRLTMERIAANGGPSTRFRLLAALRERPGMTSAELCVALGYSVQSQIAMALRAAVRAGAVRRERTRWVENPTPITKGGRQTWKRRLVWAYFAAATPDKAPLEKPVGGVGTPKEERNDG